MGVGEDLSQQAGTSRGCIRKLGFRKVKVHIRVNLGPRRASK